LDGINLTPGPSPAKLERGAQSTVRAYVFATIYTTFLHFINALTFSKVEIAKKHS
jgi:hypothetical protein